MHGSQQRLDVDQETARHQGETNGCTDSVYILKDTHELNGLMHHVREYFAVTPQVKRMHRSIYASLCRDILGGL
jgi:hypothetical protein